MDKSRLDCIPLGAAEYEAIGALAAHYALIEFQVGAAVWHFLELPAYNGTLIAGPLSLDQRFELIISLLRNQYADIDAIEKIKRIKTEFSRENGITARRNRYIHAVWGKDRDNGGAVVSLNFNKRGGLKEQPHEAADTIEAVVRDIGAQYEFFLAAMEPFGYDDCDLNFDPHSQS
jgi:hypothetical protein